MLTDKAFTTISFKYANFVNIFFLDNTNKLCDHTYINNHLMDLVDS